METQTLSFESALREMLTIIITHAVNSAMERHFAVLFAGTPIAPPVATQEFMDVNKAAEYLSLARNTIYALIYRKAIPLLQERTEGIL
jgi:hypothetical protein